MKKAIYFISLIFALSLACRASFADTVTLNNGRSLEGEILEENGETMTLRTKIGKVIFKRADVASEERMELPEGFFGARAEEKRRVTVNPVPLKAEGYGAANSGKFNLNVSAEMKSSYNGDAILVKYKTNLPQKTVLFLQVRTLNQVIVTRKHAVEGQSFAIRFGPFKEKRFSPGIYVIEVSCITSRQESEEIKKKLEGVGDIVATAEIRVGSPDEAEGATGKRRKELVAELKELDSLYNKLSLEYGSQKKKFNKERWESFTNDFEGAIEKIKDADLAYRKVAIVMDYPAQENAKISIADILRKLRIRYAEELYKANNLEFKVPPSDDSRGAEALDVNTKSLLASARSFIEKSEKETKQK
ncbi:MAG: hypothetical protein PHX64_04405 [Candidatus Omnitrophica bacterium]|nr:hypothetical protein [Candidatus Omnitrophota bacterium]MDD5310975.1 hypothetical protein [Candidatus Omnitrophota bacterium]MDD5546330.1 hypothetical protein [Candidatus Omnitrophota bacterium]